MGMQLVPEERAIFGALTVEENLRLAALTAPEAWTLDRIYAAFPRLAERRRFRRPHAVGRRAADAGDRPGA